MLRWSRDLLFRSARNGRSHDHLSTGQHGHRGALGATGSGVEKGIPDRQTILACIQFLKLVCLKKQVSYSIHVVLIHSWLPLRRCQGRQLARILRFLWRLAFPQFLITMLHITKVSVHGGCWVRRCSRVHLVFPISHSLVANETTVFYGFPGVRTGAAEKLRLCKRFPSRQHGAIFP